MRVIGGTARGRALRAPRGSSVRPTADRVREAIFDILASLEVVDGAEVIDVFAGTGALGIEALSRGARSVTFVESDPKMAAAITENLERTGLSELKRSTTVVADAKMYLQRSTRHFDLALIDPPYRFLDWEELLGTLDADLVVCESAEVVCLGERFSPHRTYRYGTTLVTVATLRSGAVAGGMP